MNSEQLWLKINHELNGNKQDIQTSTGLWFNAESRDGRIYIDRANGKSPSCKISMTRSISRNDFLFVASYYDRWVKGEAGIRNEVSRKSRNTAYIFALIKEFGR